ncbi:MAG: sulfurtransferase [Pseudomonadota bacterium]
MNDLSNSLVSTDWLADNLGADNLVVLDASLHLPAANRDARAEFVEAHIPGARFFDLASLVDKTSDVPSALPRPDQLAATIAALGIQLGDRIVIYDDSAVKTAARAWYLFTSFWIAPVAVLDGGLAKWRAEGRALESGEVTPAPSTVPDLSPPQRLRMKADILANIDIQAEQVLDARSPDRFEGEGADPVHGVEGGRIPRSHNLPFGTLYAEDGTFKSPDQIRAAFEQAGIDLDQPVTTTCGSGVTACVLLLALAQIGKTDWALYDGSWSDWGGDPATPKETGPKA